MKNYINSLKSNDQYFILTTNRIKSQPSYNIKYFFGEVEEKRDDYVLFHNIRSNIPVRAVKVYDTGFCSYYNNSDINSDSSLEGVIRNDKKYEYYIVLVKCYGKKRIDIIKPDRRNQLSLINKKSDIIYQNENIGSFTVKSLNDEITDIINDIEDIIEDTPIEISRFSPIEDRMFYSTYNRYLKKANITAEDAVGYKIRSDEGFKINSLYFN